MVVNQSLLALSTLLVAAFVSTGNADEWLDISDYRLTEVCSDTVQKYELSKFQIEAQRQYLPEISLRNPEATLDIHDLFLGAGFDGLLFQRGDRAVLHCFNQFWVMDSALRVQLEPAARSNKRPAS